MRIPIALPLLGLAVALTGCVNFGGWQTVRGSGNITTETREVAGFDRVSVSGSGQLIVTQGNDESLTIEADDNLLPLIRSDVSNGKLSLGPRNVNLSSTQPIRYRLSLKNLTGLDLSGSVQAQVDTLKTDRLALSISGSGDVRVAQLDTQTLSASISGSGSTKAAGHAESQKIHISGSGSHHAAELKSAQAEAHISGSGHASLWVDESLRADISGSGRVEYRGRATVDSHVSGSGRVRHMAGIE